MSEITIQGASGSIVTLQGGTDSDITSKAVSIQETINREISSGEAQAFNLTNDGSSPASDKIGVAIAETPGTFEPINFTYAVVADTEGASTSNNDIILTTQNYNNQNRYLTILSGRRSGLGFTAGNGSGTLVNTVGNLNFDANKKTGNWNITTGEGNHTIRTGIGQNNVTVGAGISDIYSEGQDSISVAANENSYTRAQITLAGGNSTVFAGKGGLVTDISDSNRITAFENTTVTAGTAGQIIFAETTTNLGSNTIQGGIGNAVYSSTSDLTAIHGSGNIFRKVTGNLNFLNGVGNTTVAIGKQFNGFGASGLNLTLTSGDFDQTSGQAFTGSSLFVADKGNETLNASGYDSKIQIYAYTVADAQSNLIATGGTGDDVLSAGTGNSTFTGGAGNNLFMFNKDAVTNGTTVITDFANQGSDNHIGLYGYGLNNDSITQLLSSSQNDTAGNAVLHLDNHQITLEGVTVADLKTSQFSV